MSTVFESTCCLTNTGKRIYNTSWWFIMKDLFSDSDICETYRDVYDLLVTRHIIRHHSSNGDDIRTLALEGLDLSGCQTVLELGCGYGFFVEALQFRLHPGAEISGIDLVESNREPFLHSVHAAGYRGKFIHGYASTISSFPQSSVDMIVASYSLYFFPEVLDAVYRALKPEGLFLAITHSSHTLEEATRFLPLCLKEAGITQPGDLLINRLFRAFSSENGLDLLAKYFPHVEKLNYDNHLQFDSETVDDCIYYLAKKKHLIYKEIIDSFPHQLLKIEACLAQRIYRHVQEKGVITLNKNDAIFRCYRGKGTGNEKKT